jgi:hypothetical protein
MKQKSFVVRDAHRKAERDLKDSLKRDLVAFISEILTNSDDSYRRLENSGLIPLEEVKDILIEIKEDRRKKGGYVVSITDQAEGMSEDELRLKFEDYGADKAEGQLHTRGLFGQGASDVLFNAAAEQRTAQIESFKNNKLTRAIFNYSHESNHLKQVKFVPNDRIGSQLDVLRQSIGIKENGTSVTFGIPSKVKYNPKTIIEDIESYPYFKFLLNNPHRRVILKREDELVETTLSSSTYQLVGKPLFKKAFDLKYKNFELSCQLTLWQIDKKRFKQDILVIDQHQVIYDDQFFGFDTNPKAKNLGGFLEIKDFYKVLREELNSDDRIAIITDNRKGFDSSQEFYKILKNELVRIITPKLNEIGENIEEIDISSNKKISEMLKKLNSYFVKNMPEEIPSSGKDKGVLPPEQGLAFIRDEMSLTVSKKYAIILLINSKLITDKTPITLLTENNEVISLSQNKITFKSEEANAYGLVKKSFLIEALSFSKELVKISAESAIFKTQAFIKPIEYDIHYPENGLEFYPKRLIHKPSRTHIGHLLVDNKAFSNQETIFLSTSEPGIKLEVTEINIKSTDFDENGIAEHKIHFFGGEIGSKYSVFASLENVKTSLRVEIKDSKRNEKDGTLGLISSIKFHTDEERFFEQAKFSKTDKVLMINRANPINQTMLPNLKDMTDVDLMIPKQINYLLDLCSFHGALQIVDYQLNHGEFNIQEDSIKVIEEKLYNIKTEIFSIINKT